MAANRSALKKPVDSPGAGISKSPSRKPAIKPDQTKLQRAAEIIRQLRSEAEALSANADRLLSRLS